jgi:small subunit ribosomal protein S1
VDLGGIDGLLHITDMAWRRVRHPTEVVNVGDEIEVKVLKYDRERNRVSLGLKQLGEDPWVSIAQRYPEGSRIAGRVTNIADFGAFVEIEEGVEGLVHVSEMDWTNRNIHPSRVVQIGDETQVMILDVDEERRRISLGIKQCMPNPWEEFSLTHAKGDRVAGRIKSITDFGMFVGLDGGIDGLVHVSDLSWNEDGETLLRNHRKGEEIETVVLAVDAERERISLGIKQLDRDPFSSWLNEHPRGSVLTATVAEVEPRGARVDLADGVEGYIRASEISRERVDDARTVLRAGETVEVKVIAVDRRRRGVSLSIRERESDEEATAMEQYAANVDDAPATIGDLVKEQMDRS